MSASDATVSFSQIDQDAVTLADGASNTYTLELQKGLVTWAVPARPATEQRVRNKHMSTPTVRLTGDVDVTGQLKMYVASFRGTTSTSPYELFVNGATTTASGTAGDAGLWTMAIPYTGDGGAPSQTMTFNATRFTNVAMDFEDGLMVITADFTAYINKPSVS